jgi:hypothetical protein
VHNGDAQLAQREPDGLLLHQPDPAGHHVGERVPGRRLGVQHVHHDQGETALAHIAQRLDEPLVEQRAERHDQRSRGQRRSRQPAERRPAHPPGIRFEHRVDDLVRLPSPQRGGQPPGAAPLVGDHAHPVAGGQVRPRGARGAAQAQVQRRQTRRTDI